MLFYNPKSGGGKAEKFHLADEARARGIEPIELKLGTDLEQLVRGAVADGADALAMAGGDGSQAVVAMVAAEQDLPYACIPAGTRNHFALDLGVDRDDVVGALDAFVGGRERRVDLAEVNGRVFVNNVSIGLYAEAVQREGYREAKLRTILDTLPEALGPEGKGLDLRWTGPGGHEHSSGAAILVSNNRYRLGRAVGSGTRPRIDDELLGITVASAPAARPALAPASLARVVHARVRGRRRRPDRRGHRRRGRNSGRAAALQDPAGGAGGADRRRAPRSLSVRGDARGRLGDRSRAGADRCTGDAETREIIVPMSEWLSEAKAVDTAVYGAIAASDTPSLDVAMRRLSRAADHSKLWFAAAAALALLGGPGGRLAARRGLVSLGIASGVRQPRRQAAERPAAPREEGGRGAREPPRPNAALELLPLRPRRLRLCLRHRRRQRAADALGAAAGPGDAGRILPSPYRCPLSRGRARRRLHRGQRGGAGRPPEL